MDGDLAKKELNEYMQQTRPVLYDLLDEHISKSKEFGNVQVEMLETYKRMVARGKGIRGFLVQLAYQICGGTDINRIIETSTYIELFHSAILIQDDFMDRDDLRRGLPSAHEVMRSIGADLKVRIPDLHYGYSVAVLLSDIGIYLSWQKLLNSGFEHENIKKAADIYSNYVIRLIHGQVNDLTFTAKEDVDEEDILKVLWTKSGEYTALLPLLSGAALAGETDEKRLESIKSYAKCLGWAFQIRDDILGVYGNREELGKPIGSDIKEGKNTLQVLYTRKYGTKEQVDYLNGILGSGHVSDEEIEKVRKVIKDSGAYDRVVKKGTEYAKEGISYIPDITKDKRLQNILESLLVLMVDRTN